MQQTSIGRLYIVATPIGHMDDITYRAIQVLEDVPYILAEDTRHTSKLLRYWQIDAHRKQLSFHEHNEDKRYDRIVGLLDKGEDVAVVSDAGTPLICDPGYSLVNGLREKGYDVTPVPGACAIITALCAAGLPTDRFQFEGFLPSKANAREKRLQSLADQSATLVFYESPRRVLTCLRAMVKVFGATRKACLARELTKRFETFITGQLTRLIERIQEDPEQQRGEVVLMVAGNDRPKHTETDDEVVQVMTPLVEELPVKQAARIGHRITGVSRNELYQLALTLRNNQ